MKTKIFLSALCGIFFTASLSAQDRTTVTATSYDISDNLDLKAVASIFGDSRDLEDFERRLNDPDTQISNLDLNGDNQVDYLRVIESTEDNVRLVIVQAVLERDVFQDVATIEVERSGNNNVQVQVVGNSYMYGPNYIYEPVYVTRPVFFNSWWIVGYRPYVSSWYWGYYPSYWHYWSPIPVYRYHNHVHHHINVHNHYNYVSVRGSRSAARIYEGRRNNGYEKNYGGRSFSDRNKNVSNRYELEKSRGTSVSRGNGGTRNASGTTRSVRKSDGTKAVTPRTSDSKGRTNTTRATTPSRSTGTTTTRSTSTPAKPRDLNRGNTVRSEKNLPATRPVRTDAGRSTTTPTRSNSVQTSSPRTTTQPVRSTPQRASQPVQQRSTPVQSAPQRTQSAPRSNPAPAVRSQAPQRSPQMQSAPAPRQSAPSAPRGGGNNAGGNGGRR